MTTYQGHHPDGSGIQKHSAGGSYPYVLQLRGSWWEVVGPGIDGVLRCDSSAAWDAVVRRLLAVRGNEDAWAFELEQLCMAAGQKQTALCIWEFKENPAVDSE
jgi:hypothetical protein